MDLIALISGLARGAVRRLLLGSMLLGISAAAAWAQVPLAPVAVTVLAYHDITDEPATADPDAVSTQEFSAQMTWLKTQGYQVISVQDYLDYRAGARELPAKAVLLTFDDGYLSFYTHAFPLLRALNYPSTLAVIGSWESQQVPTGTPLLSPVDNAHGMRLPLVNPVQLKELASSGLVEIASHSFDLHHGELANPQGSMIPSARARILSAGYESEADYSARLEADLARNSAWIKTATGAAPRVMVWPYGSYTVQGLRAAQKTGHLLSFGLDTYKLSFSQSEVLGRVYLTGGLRLSRFADMVRNVSTQIPARRHVGLQVTPTALTEEGLSSQWLGALVQSVFDSGANVVLLSPFMGQENGCKALFPTKTVPVVADVLSKISWQLQVRANVKVLLDVAVENCSLKDAQWEQLTLDLINLVPAHGLVVRASEQHATLAQVLVDQAHALIPAAITATTLGLVTQSFQLIPLDACQHTNSPFIARGAGFQYEVDASKCDSKPALDRLLRNGVRDFGTYNGPIRESGNLTLDTRYLMHSLLTVKS